MAENNTGAVFTQDGVPIKGSADYQKVLDSRWRFMEVEFEKDFRVSLPARSSVTFANRYFEKTTVLTHNLGFIPLFESNIANLGFPQTYEIYADETRVFLRRLVSTGGQSAEVVTGTVRVYNLPILEDYVAPKEFALGSKSPEGSVGVQFLEDRGGVDLGDVSPVGFSVDTRKKILSVHRHGLALINDYAGRIADATSIDTGTEVLTIGPVTGAPYGGDIGWIQTLGQAVSLSPNDFVTYPGGLGSGTYYIIPVDATHVRLASSYQNALDGVAVNITSSGSLPMQLSATSSGVDAHENSIYHDVGYPPTYLLAETNWIDAFFEAPETETYIGPLLNAPPTFMTADPEYINFFGVQAQFTGRFGYVILKDPQEVVG